MTRLCAAGLAHAVADIAEIAKVGANLRATQVEFVTPKTSAIAFRLISSDAKLKDDRMCWLPSLPVHKHEHRVANIYVPQ